MQPPADMTESTTNLKNTEEAASALQQDIGALEENLKSLSDALGIDLNALAQPSDDMELDDYEVDVGGDLVDQATLLKVMTSNPNLWDVNHQDQDASLQDLELWNLLSTDDKTPVHE